MSQGWSRPKYIRDNYGLCSAERCACRIEGPWIGDACPNWKSSGAATLDDLGAWQKKLKDTSE